MAAAVNDESDPTLGPGAARPAAAPLAGPAPLIPDVTLTGVLGKGGMGVVYAGRQEWIDRDVAVKVLPTSLSDPQFATRFQREAKILAGLTHPNIVACYSAGSTESGIVYLVMELIRGPTLARHLREQGPLAPLQAVAVARALAAALDHAHQAAIIHRDVKPENVLLAPKRGAAAGDPFPFDVKLADLGLARTTGDERARSDLTAPGAVLGTPSTMAPEQFEDPDHVDLRADIYGLGCVLFHALTGRHAFPPQPTLAATFSAKLAAKPPDPRALLRDLDPAIAAFVMRLVAKERADRPQSYAELLATCDRLLADPAPQRERRRVALLVGAGGLAIAATVAFWQWPREAPPRGTVARHEASLLPAVRPPAEPGTPVAPVAPAESTPVSAVAPRLLLAATQAGLPLAAGAELVEGTAVDFAATVGSDADLAALVFTVVEPPGWPITIDPDDPRRARLELPRAFVDGRVVVEAELGDALGVMPLRHHFAVAIDPRVGALERTLATQRTLDLLRHEPRDALQGGGEDPAAHRLLGGDGAAFESWLLPRGDWSVTCRFHLHAAGKGGGGGIRVEFDDGNGFELALAREGDAPAPDAPWSVVVRGVTGRTGDDDVRLEPLGESWTAGWPLQPSRRHDGDASSEDAPLESYDEAAATLTWSQATATLAVEVVRVAMERTRRAGWRERERSPTPFRQSLVRAPDPRRGSVPFAPCRALLWKSEGGLCIHAFEVAK